MEKQKNMPVLRFAEFTEEWVSKKLGEVVTNKSGKFNPQKENLFTKCIELEHLESESGRLLGFIDGSNTGSIKNKFEKGEVLFGKLRPYLKKYLQAPFNGVCSSEIWVLKGLGISNEFLYRIVQTDNFIDLANQSSGSKMPRADWSVVEKAIISFPTLSEQQKIATFFTAIDKKLSGLKEKKTLLTQYKKGVMQQLFSQVLRFKNTEGGEFAEWEVKKLGEVTDKTDKKNKANISYPVYSINNKEGFLPQSDQFEGVDSHDRGYDVSLYKIIQTNTFAYNPARIDVGSIGFSGDLNNIIISSLYVCFKTRSELNDSFLMIYLKSDAFNKAVLRKTEGGVRKYLFYENFSDIEIPLPSIPEQQKIANFLSALDEKINTVSTQIEKLETWKKGLLQKMFV